MTQAQIAQLTALLTEGDPVAVLDRIADDLRDMRCSGEARDLVAVADTLRRAVAILEEPPTIEEQPNG